MSMVGVVDRVWEPIGDVGEAERVFASLEARVQEWAGVMAAATSAVVDVIGEVDGRGLCGQFGFRSLEQWVSLRCGVSFGHAKRLVAVARSLGGLPELRGRFAVGGVSEDQLVEVARAGVTGVHDREAAELASVMSVAQLRRALSFLPAVPEPESPSSEAREEQSDPAAEPEIPSVSVPADDMSAGGVREWLSFGGTRLGVWELHVRLSAERGAVVERAIAAGRDRVYRERHGRDPDVNDPPLEVSNLDVLWHMLGLALDHADPSTRAGGGPSERYLVNVHLHADGNAQVHLGARLPAGVRDEVSCDAEVRAWLKRADGTVGLGRRARVVSSRLRTVVEHRDGGCVVPGCGRRHGLRIHHLWHWSDGGPTETWNLCALCPRDHAAVHRGDLRISGNPDLGTLTVTDRSGRLFTVGSPTPPTDDRLRAATMQASGSPWRGGESVQWHWVTWTDPAPRPPRQDLPPSARTPWTPSTFQGFGFHHLTTAWTPTRRRRRGSDHDDDDDVTYG